MGISFGRHPMLCDRVIDDPTVSRRHLRVTLREGRLSLEDLNSLNGTLLDGRALRPFEPSVAADGQSLVLGAVAFTIRELTR